MLRCVGLLPICHHQAHLMIPSAASIIFFFWKERCQYYQGDYISISRIRISMTDIEIFFLRCSILYLVVRESQVQFLFTLNCKITNFWLIYIYIFYISRSRKHFKLHSYNKWLPKYIDVDVNCIFRETNYNVKLKIWI